MNNNDKDKADISQFSNMPDVEVGNKLATVLNDLLQSEDWNSSLFLKTIRKHLQTLLDEVNSVVEEVSTKGGPGVISKNLKVGYVQLYILLYQFDSTKLQNWQYALKALTAHSISRPTYNDEKYIQEMIRTKKDINRYGYAIVNINESDIYQTEKATYDQLDHEIIMLKENAVKLDNIVGFVHSNKKYYEFLNGELVYKGDREILL